MDIATIHPLIPHAFSARRPRAELRLPAHSDIRGPDTVKAIPAAYDYSRHLGQPTGSFSNSLRGDCHGEGEVVIHVYILHVIMLILFHTSK